MSDRPVSCAAHAGLLFHLRTAPGCDLPKCHGQQYFIYNIAFKPHFQRSADSRLISIPQRSALLSGRTRRGAGLRCFELCRSEVHCTASIVETSLKWWGERQFLPWSNQSSWLNRVFFYLLKHWAALGTCDPLKQKELHYFIPNCPKSPSGKQVTF